MVRWTGRRIRAGSGVVAKQYGVHAIEWDGVRSAECGVRSAECGVRSEE